MLVDLIQTTTRDGVRLDGVYQAPARPGSARLPVDAFVMVHGTGGTFYTSSLLEALGDRLLELGIGVLRVNTRGHDLVSSAHTPRGSLRQGASYEMLDDCRHDLAAWSAWVREFVGPRVGLLGHSSGAVKCLYARAHEPHPPAACVVAVSPPRLAHSWYMKDQGAAFREAYELAKQRVAEGRAEEIIEVKAPLPMPITAGGYLEKYGPDDRYNYFRFIGDVPGPVLTTFGSLEVENNLAFRDAPQELTALKQKVPGLDVEVIPGADHFYTSGREALADALAGWLQRVLA